MYIVGRLPPEIPGGSGAERGTSQECSVSPFRVPRMPRGAYSSQHAARPLCAGRFSEGAADAAGELQVPWRTATGSTGAPLRTARGPALLRGCGRLRVQEPAVRPGPDGRASRPELSLRGNQPLLPPSLVPRRGPQVKLGGSVTAARRSGARTVHARVTRPHPGRALSEVTSASPRTQPTFLVHSVSGTLLQAGVSPGGRRPGSASSELRF